MSKYDNEEYRMLAVALILIVLVIIGGVICTVVQAHGEAASYNRLTGGHATAWDAFWTELRVATPESRP